MREMPTSNVRDFVEQLAKENQVVYQRTALDDFSEAITLTSGDYVKLDPTGKLIIALKKKT